MFKHYNFRKFDLCAQSISSSARHGIITGIKVFIKRITAVRLELFLFDQTCFRAKLAKNGTYKDLWVSKGVEIL
jgi:hypothetical protein